MRDVRQIIKTQLRGLTEVIPNVYRLPLAGTSALLLLEDQVTVIDAGWKGSGGRVVNALKRLGRSSEEIGYIVSTHYHHDHVGGIAHLRERSGGKVAAHETEVPFLQRRDKRGLPNPVQMPGIRWLMAPAMAVMQPRGFSVDLQLTDGSRLEPLGGMEIIHSPGHTPGSISLHFPREGLLMVGDALEYRRGRLELPSRWFSSNMEHARESARKLAKLDFDTLCFSHFAPIKKNASRLLKEFAETL